MAESWVNLVVAALTSGGLVGVGTYFNARRQNKNALNAAEKLDLQGRFAANIELNKYIQSAVEKALVGPNEQIAALRAEVAAATRMVDMVKDVTRRYIQRLYFWDENGRKGRMPTPSREDSEILDLSDIEADTQTRAEMKAAREAAEEG